MTLASSLEDLSTYPYAVAALDTPLGGRAGASKVAKLAPFAPSEASIFPRFVSGLFLAALNRSARPDLSVSLGAVVSRHQLPHLGLCLPLPPLAPASFERCNSTTPARHAGPRTRQGQLGWDELERVLRRGPTRSRRCRLSAVLRGSRRDRRSRAVDSRQTSRQTAQVGVESAGNRGGAKTC